MAERVILTPKNEDVEKLNDIIIHLFSGEEHNLLSFDEVDTSFIPTRALAHYFSRRFAS